MLLTCERISSIINMRHVTCLTVQQIVFDIYWMLGLLYVTKFKINLNEYKNLGHTIIIYWKSFIG